MALIGHYSKHAFTYIFACFDDLELVNLNPATFKVLLFSIQRQGAFFSFCRLS